MNIATASALIDISQELSGYRERRETSWYGHKKENSWGAFPFSASYLYRGQTTRYTPLLPSIARSLNSQDLGLLWRASTSDQANVVIRLAQSWWFGKELMHHPVASHAHNQKLELDAISIAQHYGLATGYLDLTDDFNVSAFFATCSLVNGLWEPVSTGTGVIYRAHLTVENGLKRYIPLGPQPLPRPSEQCAWVTELPMRHAFEGWPGVSMLQFQHDRRVGEYFLALFSGGDALFPKDPLAKVSEEILACGELPVDLLDSALESFATDPLGLRPDQVLSVRKEVNRMMTLTAGRRLLMPEDISLLTSDPTWCNDMLADVKVKWVAVCNKPVA